MIYDYELCVLVSTKLLISLGTEFVHCLCVIWFVGYFAHRNGVNKKSKYNGFSEFDRRGSQEVVCVVIQIFNKHDKYPMREVTPNENVRQYSFEFSIAMK